MSLVIFGHQHHLHSAHRRDHQPHHPFLLLFSSLGLVAAAIVTGEQASIGHHCCCLVVITPQATQRKIGALDRHQLFPNCHHCCCCYSLQSTSPSHSQQAVFLTIHHQTSSQAAASTSGRQQAFPLPCNVPLLLAVRSLLIGAAFCLLFFVVSWSAIVAATMVADEGAITSCCLAKITSVDCGGELSR